MSKVLEPKFQEGVIDALKANVESSSSCKVFMKKSESIFKDLRDTMIITFKYLPDFNKELPEFKKQEGLSEEDLADINFVEEIIKMSEKSGNHKNCSFNTGVSIECSEGTYKFMGSNGLKEISTTKRNSMKKSENSNESVGSKASKNIAK